jgi:hypothetical protein
MEGKTFAEFTNCRLYLIMHKPVHIITVSPAELGLMVVVGG